MGSIVVSENLTLDGVMEAPTGENGDKGWFDGISDTDRAAWAEAELDEVLHAESLLMGRTTYEFFAGRWPLRSGPWADRLNSMPKCVVSTTLTDPRWTNSTVLAGAVVDEVSRLKQAVDGETVVYGSRKLVRLLLDNDLVDGLRLIVCPFVVGAGARLFDGPGATGTTWRLVEARAIGDNLALLAYERTSDA